MRKLRAVWVLYKVGLCFALTVTEERLQANMKKNTSSSQSRLTAFFGGNGSEKSSKSTPHRGSSINAKPWSGKTAMKRANGGSSFGVCPMCQKSIALYKLESHAATCEGTNACPWSYTRCDHHQRY